MGANNNRAISVLLVGLSLLPIVARAELTVIYDNGVTQPLAPFLSVFAKPTTSAPRQLGQPNDLGAADLSRLLPIRSPELTPGLVTRRSLHLPNTAALSRPFFLIGADERSRQWLATHRDRLQAIGAVGMLVHATTVEELEVVARIAGGLSIVPASGSDIARVLRIQHVPVLISRRGIEQ